MCRKRSARFHTLEDETSLKQTCVCQVFEQALTSKQSILCSTRVNLRLDLQ